MMNGCAEWMKRRNMRRIPWIGLTPPQGRNSARKARPSPSPAKKALRTISKPPSCLLSRTFVTLVTEVPRTALTNSSQVPLGPISFSARSIRSSLGQNEALAPSTAS
jgi:hypothetical protein